jgi:hypothetical protein
LLIAEIDEVSLLSRIWLLDASNYGLAESEPPISIALIPSMFESP